MKSRQITSRILMIRPVAFHMNQQTAVNNYYQNEVDGLANGEAQLKALKEFDGFVAKLRKHGVHVTVIEDRLEYDTPDSIFPNNWVSFHHDGRVGLYPMFAENRRSERRMDVFDMLRKEGFEIENIVDFSFFEAENKFLEGTGSMLLDRDNHIVYAALSDRTNLEVLKKFCEEFSYKPIVFRANQTVDNNRLPIYHTNVMMGLTSKLAIICLDSIDDPEERNDVIEQLEADDKEIVELTEAQVNEFAGNMLGVSNTDGEEFLVMSDSARLSLSNEQVNQIEKYYRILSSSLHTIETLGGGSARCMMAELFLPKNEN